jgi:hypothetical protein
LQVKNLNTLTTGVTGALFVLNRIAASKGDSVKSVTIDASKSNDREVVGLVTLANKRSRKPFKVTFTPRKVHLDFMGVKLAA